MKKYYFICGAIILSLICILLYSLTLLNSRADDTEVDLSITNTAPTVNTVITAISSGGADTGNASSTGITIAESPATTTIYVRGQAADSNGCQQISKASGDWKLKVYRTGASGAGSGATCTTASNNDCYNVAESDLTLSNCEGGEDTTVDYEFAVTLTSYTYATDAGSAYSSDTWTSKVTVVDNSSASANSTDLFELGSTVGIGFDDNTCIKYGSLNLGVTSSDVACLITTTGNTPVDINIHADGDMACNGVGSGSIPVANAKYAVSANVAYTNINKIALSTTTTPVDITIGSRTPSANYSGNIFFQLKAPASGVSGFCQNIVYFTSSAAITSQNFCDVYPDQPGCEEGGLYFCHINPNDPSCGGGGGGPYTLAVSKVGNGMGTVSSIPGNIDCGSTCSGDFQADTMVLLNAGVASGGSTFGGWSGDCTGMASQCNVTMDQARSVVARFDIAT